jgi:hypothetical protein
MNKQIIHFKLLKRTRKYTVKFPVVHIKYKCKKLGEGVADWEGYFGFLTTKILP